MDLAIVSFQLSIGTTVWKFGDFSVTQILRENKVGGSKVLKSVTLTHFEALNFGL